MFTAVTSDPKRDRQPQSSAWEATVQRLLEEQREVQSRLHEKLEHLLDDGRREVEALRSREVAKWWAQNGGEEEEDEERERMKKDKKRENLQHRLEQDSKHFPEAVLELYCRSIYILLITGRYSEVVNGRDRRVHLLRARWIRQILRYQNEWRCQRITLYKTPGKGTLKAKTSSENMEKTWKPTMEKTWKTWNIYTRLSLHQLGGQSCPKRRSRSQQKHPLMTSVIFLLWSLHSCLVCLSTLFHINCFVCFVSYQLQLASFLALCGLLTHPCTFISIQPPGIA